MQRGWKKNDTALEAFWNTLGVVQGWTAVTCVTTTYHFSGADDLTSLTSAGL